MVVLVVLFTRFVPILPLCQVIVCYIIFSPHIGLLRMMLRMMLRSVLCVVILD